MTEAFIGLLGVLVGGLISGGATYLLTRRAERIRAKAAARLIEQELSRVADSVDGVVDEVANLIATEGADNVWKVEIPILKDFAPIHWREHQGMLAETLSDAEWVAVADAYATAFTISGYLKRWSENKLIWEKIVPEKVVAIKKGVDAISRLSGTATVRSGPRAPAGDYKISLVIGGRQRPPPS